MSQDLWRPPCPCGTRCTSVPAPRAGLLTVAGRLLAAAAVLALAAARPTAARSTPARPTAARSTPARPTAARSTPARSTPPRDPHPWRIALLGLFRSPRDVDHGRHRRLARAMLRALGIRWSVTGAPIQPGVLLVGNHVSWLDIIVLMAVDGRIRQVAKTEVGSWPVIGRLARAGGTIFVDRAKPKSLPSTVAEVTAALRNGHPVQVFPEGTTTCGTHRVPWRPAFLQAAIDAEAPVQRFTLIFSSPAAAFVGDDSLLHCLRRILSLPALSVTVFVDEPRQVDAGAERRLARRGLAARLGPSLESERVHDRRGA